MKVLWLVNTIMPELAEAIGRGRSCFGGWLEGAQDALKANGYEMVICTTSNETGIIGRYPQKKAVYYVVENNDFEKMQRDFSGILSWEEPDVVHIYGTEMMHAWALSSVSDPDRTVVTLQGLLFLIKSKVYAGISARYCKDTLLHKILRKLHKGGTSIELQRRSFEERAKYEELVLEKAKYINGLSDWGNAAVRMHNKDCELLPCGSVLREEFYDGSQWKYEKCEPHSICCIYSYPIKGFHKLLEAVSIVKRYYPDVKIRAIAKPNPYRHFGTIKSLIMDLAPDYEWYVQKQIEKYGLQENIEFPGFVAADEMKNLMLKSNVFVSASAIENQSTAIGEAMLLGLPTVISCVGDAENMIAHKLEGFIYEFDQTQMLAYYLCELFADRELAETVSRGAHKKASVLFGKEQNTRMLLDMYNRIMKNRTVQG